MGYDRAKAIAYAEKHWNVPCDDGKFGLTNDRPSVASKRMELHAPAADGWKPEFVKGSGEPEKFVFRRTTPAGVEEKIISNWAGLADCAHFLSQCLSAGGATTNEWGVAGLVQNLQSRSDTKTLCERVAQAAAQRVINSGVFKQGDMIGYFNVDPDGDYGGRPSYTHSTMFAGKPTATDDGRVTCHTVARFPGKTWAGVEDRWWLHSGYTYTLIHFVSDDSTPNLTRAAALEGWWMLEYSGRTEYYYIFRDGRARYTKRAPKSAREQLAVADGGAYWFMDAGGKITFVWRATGTLEVWTPSPPDMTSYRSLINGATPGVVTKLF
ncbi:amidase domain-containing protein [uncultured Rhodoblastus sp.]|uniref:amidase domain-containing protein n=1 Tax=uncultured Rhodoblastus sp. TaxID=543037 RepID=UPI0025D9A4DF|nr:amidase domain-containing protein [uncultured Rhodoblastus sp.]